MKRLQILLNTKLFLKLKFQINSLYLQDKRELVEVFLALESLYIKNQDNFIMEKLI
jgi:hypothetical protein